MNYLVFLAFSLVASFANAVSYDCAVTKKLDFENVYQPAQMEKYKFSARIHDSEKPRVDRCSIKPNDKSINMLAIRSIIYLEVNTTSSSFPT
jgi:hypothetical protein